MAARVGIDMDAVLCDLHTAWLERYNSIYADHVVRDDITDWDMARFLKPECGERINELLTAELYDQVEPIEGAVAAFVWLTRHLETYIITSSHPRLAPAKCQWLERNIPGFDWRQLIFTPHKHLLRVDYLVDDDPVTCKAALRNGVIPILFAAPWNRADEHLPFSRCNGWSDVIRLLGVQTAPAQGERRY